MGEGSTECRDFFDELVILTEDSALWRRVMSGNVINKMCASVKLQGTVNCDETRTVSINCWYYQAHGVNPSTV